MPQTEMHLENRYIKCFHNKTSDPKSISGEKHSAFFTKIR